MDIWNAIEGQNRLCVETIDSVVTKHHVLPIHFDRQWFTALFYDEAANIEEVAEIRRRLDCYRYHSGAFIVVAERDSIKELGFELDSLLYANRSRMERQIGMVVVWSTSVGADNDRG